MQITIENTGSHGFFINYQNFDVLIMPGESRCFDVSGDFSFEVKHIKSKDGFVFFTLLDTMISYERTRIELKVNGKYTFSNDKENNTIKIRTYEYVVDKYVSYKAFVFCCDHSKLRCTQYEVHEKETVLKKCKFLYLISGGNILLPICLCLLFFSLVCILMNINQDESAFLTIVSAIASIFLFINYLRRLNLLKKMLLENSISSYMMSSRKEKRTLEDKEMEKYLGDNTDKGFYW